MAARATRSASRKARVAEAVATGPLGALGHDELGVIFDGLADPLQPVVAVALSSTCLGLWAPLRAALGVLKERHERAKALCRKLGDCHPGSCPSWVEMSCAGLAAAEVLSVPNRSLAVDDMATLGMILRTNGLPRLRELRLFGNDLGDAGVQTLCEGLGRGLASLRSLVLGGTGFGPAGAAAVAAALRSGVMRRLEVLYLNHNPIDEQSAAALAAALRKLPALKMLNLDACAIGDEDVASLVDNLGKDDFKALESINLYGNKLTDAGRAKLAEAIDAGGLPNLRNCIGANQARDALERRRA